MSNEETLRQELAAANEKNARLYRASVTREVESVLKEAGAKNVTILFPAVMKNIKIDEKENSFTIINPKNNRDRVDDCGKSLSLKDFVAELKTKESFMQFFGNTSKSKSKSNKIPASSLHSLKAGQLEDIVSGVAEVDMDN